MSDGLCITECITIHADYAYTPHVYARNPLLHNPFALIRPHKGVKIALTSTYATRRGSSADFCTSFMHGGVMAAAFYAFGLHTGRACYAGQV